MQCRQRATTYSCCLARLLRHHSVVALHASRAVLAREDCSEACASAQAIESATDGFGIWALTATFCGLVLIATTFISHTVGAIVILPIVGAVGAEMQVRPVWQFLASLPCTPRWKLSSRGGCYSKIASRINRAQRLRQQLLDACIAIVLTKLVGAQCAASPLP